MNGKLKQGKWYWNTSERLLYKVEEVVEVDGDDWLAVHLEDGARRTWNARALAAVSAPASSPWWLQPFTPGIAEELQARGVEHLYHFTALPNLQGIAAAGGLFSTRIRHLLRLEVPVPGGDPESRDRDWALDNASFVHLCLSRCTPLRHEFKKRNPDHPLVMFCLSRSLAGADGSRITLTNAISSRAQRSFDPIEALPHLNFDSFHWEPDQSDAQRSQWKHDVQAEVLIPDHIPLSFIQEIVVESEADVSRVEAVFGKRFPISVANFKQWKQWCPPHPPHSG